MWPYILPVFMLIFFAYEVLMMGTQMDIKRTFENGYVMRLALSEKADEEQLERYGESPDCQN